MAKFIELTKGKAALVDDEIFEYLNQWKWYFDGRYAVRRPYKKGIVYMHNFIMKTPKGMDTDHKDRNKLNNQKSNLRIVTRSENEFNKPLRKDNTSGEKGITWDKNRNKWYAAKAGKFIGRFNNLEEAKKARAYA